MRVAEIGPNGPVPIATLYIIGRAGIIPSPYVAIVLPDHTHFMPVIIIQQATENLLVVPVGVIPDLPAQLVVIPVPPAKKVKDVFVSV